MFFQSDCLPRILHFPVDAGSSSGVAKAIAVTIRASTLALRVCSILDFCSVGFIEHLRKWTRRKRRMVEIWSFWKS